MAHHFKSDQDGSGTILSIFMSVGLLVGMGVAIDVTNAFRTQKQLQLASDAAALAATTLVGDQDAAIQRGLDVTARNLKDGIHGGAVTAEDFEFGTFDVETREFTVSEFPNAVRVTAKRDTSRNNPVNTYVVGLIGKDHWDVEAVSIATVQVSLVQAATDDGYCADASILTRGALQTGGGNTWQGEICLHGDQSVHTGGDDFKVLARG